MKCSKCGGLSADSKGYCTFCGTVMDIDTKAPSWWGRPDWAESNVAQSENIVDISLVKVTLLQCRICKENSLFFNTKYNYYECLNVRCKASGKTPDTVIKIVFL
jgi:hypothetical protein